MTDPKAITKTASLSADGRPRPRAGAAAGWWDGPTGSVGAYDPGFAPRTVCWFSCGAASAVATKLVLDSHDDGRLVVAYTEVVNEHPDNRRFLADCEQWFAKSRSRFWDGKVTILKNKKYHGDIYEVFRGVRYLKGPSGAACTRILKKEVRQAFEEPDDIQVFGYTADEQKRVDRFLDANSGVRLRTPLIEYGVTKAQCLATIKEAGIELPAMYKLGYRNNNCVGCVKGEAGYWNKIRVDFPDVFERMAQMEEHLGRTVCKMERGGTLTRIPLRQLPPDLGRYAAEPEVECGIFCSMKDDEKEPHDHTD